MVLIEGAKLVYGKDLELLSLPAGRLFSLVVWRRPSVATFSHVNYFKCVFQLPKPSSHPLHPSLPPIPPVPMLRWPKINAHRKKTAKSLEIQPLVIYNFVYL